MLNGQSDGQGPATVPPQQQWPARAVDGDNHVDYDDEDIVGAGVGWSPVSTRRDAAHSASPVPVFCPPCHGASRLTVPPNCYYCHQRPAAPGFAFCDRTCESKAQLSLSGARREKAVGSHQSLANAMTLTSRAREVAAHDVTASAVVQRHGSSMKVSAGATSGGTEDVRNHK